MRNDSEKHLLQDKDHSKNDPHLFPGSLHLISGMFPERFRIELGLVGSKNSTSLERTPKVRLSVPLNSSYSFSCHSTLNSLEPERCEPFDFWECLCPVPCCYREFPHDSPL